MRYLYVRLFTLGFSFLGAYAQADSFAKYSQHTDFDAYFSKYTKRYFGPGFDWKYFKAQAVAESNLNPEAKSHVGAKGLMQIMPATYNEIQKKNKYIEGQSTDPRWNIAAALWYNKQLFDYWESGRSIESRLRFTFGSYNAGKGSILKAQRAAINQGLNPKKWASVEKVLPRVTGKHSKETINYVRKIEQIKEDI